MPALTFGSVCSGIEAASVAWELIGWHCAFVSEVDRFPCALLSHYWPSVPNYGDLNECAQWPAHAIDVLVGGTPCQDFSVAGQRAGMGGVRGWLTMRFLDCVERFAPTWIVWENVPGVLSSNGGRDFGAFLGGLEKRGYGFAYRVLDAQYFGLAQRRERVFVVGHIGGAWQRAAAVLFDAPRLRWNPPPSRQARERVAPTVEGRAGRSGRNNFATSGGLCEVAGTIGGRGNRSHTEIDGNGAVIPIQEIGKRCSGTPENGVGYGQSGDPMFTIQAGAQHGIAHTLSAEGHDASEDGTGRGVPLVAAYGGNKTSGEVDVATTQQANGSPHGRLDFASETFISCSAAVRRLTPREVERLQGFPDDYTLIPYRGKPACDGPRYRALGNSMAVPLVRWLGRRIELVHNLLPCPP